MRFDLQGHGVYFGVSLVLLCAGGIVAFRNRGTLELFSVEYRDFLTRPWRLVTFVIATFSLAVIAPYTGDPTWDYGDATLMAVLTFATAPWVMGCLWRGMRGARGGGPQPSALFVAVVCWMASAAWSYDYYLLLRDRIYPASAGANVLASSVLYVAAGLFWSLDWRSGRGVTFAFLEPDWPRAGAGSAFRRLVGYALAFAGLVTITLWWFFLRP